MANVVAARTLNWQRAATDHFNQRRCPRLHRQVHQTVRTRRLVDCHQDFLSPNAPTSLLVMAVGLTRDPSHKRVNFAPSRVPLGIAMKFK